MDISKLLVGLVSFLLGGVLVFFVMTTAATGPESVVVTIPPQHIVSKDPSISDSKVVCPTIPPTMAPTPAPTPAPTQTVNPTPVPIPLPTQPPKPNINNPKNQYDLLYSKPKYKDAQINVAIVIIAVGRYITLGKQCMEGFQKYFCSNKPNIRVHYLLFTDSTEKFSDDVTSIYTTLRPWPESTLYRFDIIAKQVELLDLYKYDYIYYTDADQKPVDHFCEDIFGERVATRHPYFDGDFHVGYVHPGYDTNPQSQACITSQDLSKVDQYPYISAAFFGASGSEFLQMMSVCRYTVDLDFKHNVVARWHDESHVNKYFLLYQPTLMLNYSYMVPEPPTNERFDHMKGVKPLILAVNKDAAALRT